MVYVVGQGLSRRVSNLEWTITGEVTLPLLESIEGLKYLRNAFTIGSAKVSATVAGSSTYTIQVISYDSSGANPVTHINTSVSLSTDKAQVNATVSIPAIDAGRNVELKIQQTSGTACTDLVVSLY